LSHNTSFHLLRYFPHDIPCPGAICLLAGMLAPPNNKSAGKAGASESVRGDCQCSVSVAIAIITTMAPIRLATNSWRTWCPPAAVDSLAFGAMGSSFRSGILDLRAPEFSMRQFQGVPATQSGPRQSLRVRVNRIQL
jgi:hypothetical protein